MADNIPGVGEVLEIPPQIIENLEKAQKTIDQMAAASEKIADSMSKVSVGMGILAKKAAGMNIKMNFNEDGILRKMTLVSDAVGKIGAKSGDIFKGMEISGKEALNNLAQAVESTSKKMASSQKGSGASEERITKLYEQLANASKMDESSLESLRVKASEYRRIVRQLLKEAPISPSIDTQKVKEAETELERLTEQIDKLASRSKQQKKIVDLSGLDVDSATVSTIKKTITELESAISKAETTMGSGPRPAWIIQAKDEVERLKAALHDTGGELKGMQEQALKPFNKMLLGLEFCEKAAGRLGTMLRRTFSTVLVANVVKNMTAIRGEFQMAERSLAVIIKDSAMARDIFNDIQKIAIKSPFQVKDLVQQTKQLAAYRIENEKLIETTKMLGDISAGVGVDMQRLILAYGQVKAATFLKGTELRQFSEAGVNVLGALANRFSEIQGRIVTTGEVLQMVSKRLVSFEDVDAVLRAQTAAGGAFYRMQEKQAETIQGRISNIKDRLDLAYNQIGKDYEKVINRVLDLTQMLIDNADVLETMLSGAFGFGAAAAIVGVLSKVTKSFIATRTAANLATGGLVKFLGGLAKGGPAIMAAAAALGVLVTVILKVTRHTRELNNIAKETRTEFDEMKSSYDSFVDVIADSSRPIQDRNDALKELKVSLGNILPLQNATIEDLGREKAAYEQHIDILRQHNIELAKEKALREAIARQDRGQGIAARSAADITRTLFSSSQNGIITDFLFGDKTPEEAAHIIGAAFDRMVERVRAGEIDSEEAAVKELISTLESYVKGSDKGILEGMLYGKEGKSVLSTITRSVKTVFQPFQDGEEVVKKVFGDIDFRFGEVGKPIKAAIENAQKVYEQFIKTKGASGTDFRDVDTLGQMANDTNYLQQKAREYMQPYYDEIKAMIWDGSKDIEDEQRKALEVALNTAWQNIDTSETMKTVQKLSAKLNKQFGTEFNIMDALSYKEGTQVGAWLDKIWDIYGKAQEVVKLEAEAANGVSEEVAQLSMADLGLTLEQAQNIINALENSPELDTLFKLLGKGKYSTTNQNKSKSEISSEISSFISDVRTAVKEFDKLDDKGKSLEKTILKLRADKLHIKMLDDFSEEGITKWVNSLKGKLEKIDITKILLDAHKDELADQIAQIEQRVAALWDKYDTAKKFRDWGVSLGGYNTGDIYDQLLQEEEALRQKGTEDSIKAADEIKRRRLEILRSEQEEAGKLMYEAQKKALSKTRQAYESMYEDIRKIITQANNPELDSKISQEDIRSAVLSRQKMAAKEVADAQWEAFKATQSYVLAFGNLDNLGADVLLGLKTELEALAKTPLKPDDARAIAKALTNINGALKGGGGTRVTSLWGALTDGYKKLEKSNQLYTEALRLEKDYAAQAQVTTRALEQKEEAQAKVDRLQLLQTTMQGRVTSAENALAAASTPEERAAAERDLAQARAALALVTSNLTLAQGELNDKTDEFEKQQAKSGQIAGDMAEAFNGAAEAVSESGKQLDWIASRYDKITGAIGSAVSTVKDTFESLGGVFSDELNAGIEGFTKGMALVSSALATATAAKEAYAAATTAATGAEALFMSIAWPLLAIAAALGAAVAVVQANIAGLKKTIDQQKAAVEDLKREYDELHDTMEQSLSNTAALSAQKAMIDNLRMQEEALKEAIEAAKDVIKKNPSEDNKNALKSLQESLEDTEKKIVEAKGQWLEFMGATDDWRDLQNDWASGWLGAFRETGDGLSSLQGDFDDFVDNIIATIVSGQIFDQWTANFRDAMNRILDDQEITIAEQQEINRYRAELAQLNQRAKAYLEQSGVGGYGAMDNDTLQRGIQNITEQTAQALEALLNSTRAAVWENNTILRSLADFTMTEGDNTIMVQMRAQTEYLRTLATVAEAVYFPGSHAKGSGGIKVFVD